jgi:hypothetical protein
MCHTEYGVWDIREREESRVTLKLWDLHSWKDEVGVGRLGAEQACGEAA